jgi:hypothetical protein
MKTIFLSYILHWSLFDFRKKAEKRNFFDKLNKFIIEWV